jgi:hypothetical protein
MLHFAYLPFGGAKNAVKLTTEELHEIRTLVLNQLKPEGG